MAASPSTENYRLGKGVWSFMRDGESIYTDLGNSPESNLTLTIEKLDHFSQRSGVRNKDKSIILEKSGTVELQLDEWSEYNLGLALLATTNTDGSLEIFGENAIEGALKFTSDTEVGPNFILNLDKVSFSPGQALSMVGDDWGVMTLSGEILSVSGLFGRLSAYADQA